MTKERTMLIQKDLAQRNCLKQLLTHKVPTSDVKNTHGKN